MAHALSDKEVKAFALSAVEYTPEALEARGAEKAEVLHYNRLYALGYWTEAQDRVRSHGWRVSKRVKQALYDELDRIAKEEKAAGGG
jgi:hypothetical protein